MSERVTQAEFVAGDPLDGVRVVLERLYRAAQLLNGAPLIAVFTLHLGQLALERPQPRQALGR